MSVVKKVRASLIELFSRETPTIKEGNDFIYLNGEDNLYPYEIERVVNNSPTANRSAKLYAKFTAGAGVVNPETDILYEYKDLPFVNKKKAYKITDIIRMGSQSMAVQGGVWFHVGWGINENGVLYQSHIDVLDYKLERKGKEDDEDNYGKIYVKDWKDKAKFGQKKKEVKWYYPYNPDFKVVAAQIKADADGETDLSKAIKKYKGQVFYLNLTPEYEYALAPVDSVYNDADTEYRMGLYSNASTREGFLGKVLLLTAGLDEEDEKTIDADVSEWLGAENAGNVQKFSFPEGTDLASAVVVQQLKPQFDDKLFVESDRRLRRNIMGAFNNIPEALVTASDGALFGTTADTYREMKLFYSEQVEEEREKLQETLTYLGFPCVIEPIVKKETAATSDKQADAQAALKGSVGGVTALIALQQSVSAGTTTFDSAVQIIETIYGIDRETAVKMIGNPIEAPITETPTENV